jgi:endonuclease IV
MRFGLKTALNDIQLKNKLKINPNLVELHILESDFDDLDAKLAKVIKLAPNAKIVFHCPFLSYKKAYMNLTDLQSLNLLLPLYEYCKTDSRFLGIVVHPEDYKNEDKVTQKAIIVDAIAYLEKHEPDFREYTFFENISGPFGKQIDTLLEILDFVQAKHICFDVSHFAAYNSEADFKKGLTLLKSKYEIIYYHLSDHLYGDGNSRAANIGNGQIDFEELLIDLEIGIVETNSRDEDVGEEMIIDYLKISEILKLMNAIEE